MTIRELIATLKEYDPDTEVQMDYGGSLEEIDAVYESGEVIWQLPYFDHYQKQVRTSHIADLNNSPGRAGHAIMAGAFLGEFAEDTPWVHLDIAGTANTDSEHDLGPKGPTGAMTRTLVKLIMSESK